MADEQRTKVTNNSLGVWNGGIIKGGEEEEEEDDEGEGERIEKENKSKIKLDDTHFAKRNGDPRAISSSTSTN